MGMTVERLPLLSALRRAAKLVHKRETMPILRAARLCRDKEILWIEATDTDSWLALPVPVVECTTEPPGLAGEFCLPTVGKVADCLKASSAATVRIGEGKIVAIDAGPLMLELEAIPAVAWPVSGDRGAPVWQATLGPVQLDVLARVMPAICREETRYYLNGVILHDEDGCVRAVATDGHRLHCAELALVDAQGALPENVIVPRRAMKTLLSLAAETPAEAVGFSVFGGGRGIEARFASGARLVSKTIDGSFPDYRRIMPASTQRSAAAERSALLEAVEAISPGLSGRGVKLSFGEADVTVAGEWLDVAGSAEATLPCEGGLAGEELYLNARFLADACHAFAGRERIVFAITQDRVREGGALTDPFVVCCPEDPGFRVVMMPMRG